MSNAPRRLVGGSAGMTTGGFSSPLVHPGVKLFEPSAKRVVEIRILPAFPRDMHGAITDQAGFVPYRLEAVEGGGNADFSDWFVEATGYASMGPNRIKMISPTTGSANPLHGEDPFVDLYRAAQQSTDPAIKELTKKDGKTEQERMMCLQWPHRMYLVNVLLWTDAGVFENNIMRFSLTGLQHLMETLNRPATRTSPRREVYDEYLFGDVTSPAYGLLGTVKAFKFGPAKMETTGVFFGRKTDDWDGVKEHTFDPQSEEGQAYLLGRYDLTDCENVVRIPSKNDMVAAIFSGKAWLPYDWAAGVLQDLGYEVPKNPHRNTTVSQPAPAAAPRPAVAPRPAAPPARSVAPAAAATRPAAAPAATAATRPAAAPAAPAAQRAAAPAAPAARPAAAPAAARPVAGAPASAPRPTVATKAPARPTAAPAPEPAPEPAAEAVPPDDEAALGDQGLAPAAADVEFDGVWTEAHENELIELERLLQESGADFTEVQMQRTRQLTEWKDQAATAPAA